MKFLIHILIILSITITRGYTQTSPLTIEKIMQDPNWIGTSPKSPVWATNGQLYFRWNPEKTDSDSLYYISLTDHKPVKVSYHLKDNHISQNSIIYNSTKSAFCYSKKGDLFFSISKSFQPLQITATLAFENLIGFTNNDSAIAYQEGDDIYVWDIKTGTTKQLSNIISGKKPSDKTEKKTVDRESVLQAEQLRLFPILKDASKKKKEDLLVKKLIQPEKLPFKFYLEDRRLNQLRISPDGNVITILCSPKSKDGLKTIVPNYVTESGYTIDIDAREKVGEEVFPNQMSFYSFLLDSIIEIDFNNLPDIRKVPEFYNDYPAVRDSLVKKNNPRPVFIHEPVWASSGHKAIFQVYSLDNKDRWICLFDGMSQSLKVLDHQHDEAWIGGPLCGRIYSQGYLSWINDNEITFVSEVSGYSHMYLLNIQTNEKKQITKGKYEVQDVTLSNDKKSFYLVTNEVHPGCQVIVKLDIKSEGKEIITNDLSGLENVSFSSDGKWVAYLSSKQNIPGELYLQELKTKGKKIQITNLARSEEFLKYPWRTPDVIKIKARDGVEIYSRVYKPAKQDPLKPAVIFVHGAGYLQNAHFWWSTYFREYMFHNMLTDLGYVVLDMDYRASKGYGRDVRTGIYRHMGGKDLDDQVDGAKYLVDNYKVDPARIGIYGGSYGGFIAFMALFTQPDVFKAGAALRPVTDWQHYNHGYTSAILNTPLEDSIAYARSSPINFAEGLKNRLLICHGMVDTNVHFQDVVRLQQRLIDLGKDNWEVAAYPMENHAFIYPSSWTDEYKRILKLFEEELRDKH